MSYDKDWEDYGYDYDPNLDNDVVYSDPDYEPQDYSSDYDCNSDQ